MILVRFEQENVLSQNNKNHTLTSMRSGEGECAVLDIEINQFSTGTEEEHEWKYGMEDEGVGVHWL